MPISAWPLPLQSASLAARDDLRLLVMLGHPGWGASGGLARRRPSVIESEGRALFQVDTRYLGRNPAQRFEEQVARAVTKALAEEGGSVLVFPCLARAKSAGSRPC